jgi:hypothetical protein
VAACLLVEASQLHTGIDDLDEGYFAQQAVRVLHGQVPYRDFETLYSPGLAYVHAGLFALLNGPSLLGMRALAWLARGATCLLLYALARPLVRNPWWAIVPGLVLLIGLDDAPVRWEPHPGWLSTVFALVAMWLMTRRQPLLTALAAAAAFAFKQNTGVYILAAALAWCWFTHQSWRRVLIAFMAPTLVWVAPLALIAHDHLASMAVLVGAVNQSGLFSAPEPTIVIPLAAIVGGVWLLRRDSQPYLRWYLLGGLAVFLTEFPRMDTLHLMWSTPPLLVLGIVALERAPRLLTPVALLAVGLLLWPTISDRVVYVGDTDQQTQTADELEQTVADIQQRTAEGEPIFVYPTSPLLYVLANRPNPTRFDHLNPGAATSSQIDTVIADLQHANVRVLVVSDFWKDVWGPPGANAPLEAWIDAHFREVARHGAYRVLAYNAAS